MNSHHCELLRTMRDIEANMAALERISERRDRIITETERLLKHLGFPVKTDD